ncbi:MAG: aldo/keto reductase [Candidatus Kariarchaeaceae archaeon]|jgi:aryl-alcohol dehydrogenase-like predicted oxidoreductase
MNFRKIGNSGLKVSEISFGTWFPNNQLDNDLQMQLCIKEALKNGINHFDTADVYKDGRAEKILGAILKDESYQRKDLVISSKVFWPTSTKPNDFGLSRKHIFDSISQTLKRLKIEYLDIYYCHRFDSQTTLEETINSMDDLIQQQKILYWGTSVWNSAQLERVQYEAKMLGAEPPIVEQARYNMIDRYIELEIMDTIKFHNIGLITWSPLSGGLLTQDLLNNKLNLDWILKKNEIPRSFVEVEKIRKLSELAKSLEISLSQLAISWILKNKNVNSIVTGAMDPSHVISNVHASEVKLSNPTIEEVESILLNTPRKHPIYRNSIDRLGRS